MMNRTRFSLLASLAALLGCSGGDREVLDVFPVTGTVRLDGQAIGGVSIVLVPQGDARGRGGHAVSDEAGNFSLVSEGNRKGVPAGTYRVLFSKLTMPDGSPLPRDVMAADVGAENILPARYNDPEQTPIEVTVTAGENAPLQFDLQSK